jgi:hypothetical protein
MAQQLISEIAAIHWRLQTKMTVDQKADWQRLADRKLDALDALYRPVDQWGRAEAQQKEDAENPCRCRRPAISDYSQTCCATCGFFCEGSDACGCCGNLGKCSIWCADNEEYWEPRTWQTCRDCGVYVLGLSNHQKTCEQFIWNETHCDECGKICAHVSRSNPTEARCWCAYDQDDLNKMDLVNRR